MIDLKDSVSVAKMAATYVIAFLGAYISSNLVEHYRVSKKMKSKVMGCTTLLLLMAISLGGIAIWTVQFTVLTLPSYDENGIEVEKFFGIGVTILAIVISIFFTFCGLYTASYDRAFSKSKSEIANMVMEDARFLSIQQIRKSNSLVHLALSKDLTPLILGGIITGASRLLVLIVSFQMILFLRFFE
jgi:hypothetical protein